MFEFGKKSQLEQCSIDNKTSDDKSGIITAGDGKWETFIQNASLHMYE